MRKGVTLVELLVAVAIVFVVVLAAFSLDSVSRNFYTSSQSKAVVLNRLMFAVDHIQKKAYRHNGNLALAGSIFSNDGSDLIFSVDNPSAPTPTEFSDDLVVRYSLSNDKLTYCGNWSTVSASCISSSQDIVDNVDELTFENMTDGSSRVYGLYVNATAYLDIGKHRQKNDPRKNPPVVLNSSVYFEEQSAQ